MIANHGDSLNSWKVKTVETRPDGNANIVYTNAAGQVMLFVYHDATANADWVRYYQYDSEGRTILQAETEKKTPRFFHVGCVGAIA